MKHFDFFQEILDFSTEWKEKPIMTWEAKDTIRWLTHTLVEAQIDEEGVNMEGFLLPGQAILDMREFEFGHIDEIYGQYIYNRFNEYRQNSVVYPPEPIQIQSKGKENNPEKPIKRPPGRPRLPNPKKKPKKTGRLWEFIRDLLLDPATCPSIIKWDDYNTRKFKFVDTTKVAALWGKRKCNDTMSFEKLSRAMRYYYKNHIFESVAGRRLVYSFGKNAKGLETSNPNFAIKAKSDVDENGNNTFDNYRSL